MKRIARALIGAVLAVALPAAAIAQSTLLQGGAWTPGHAPIYAGQGSSQPVVTDSGPAGGGGVGLGLSEILQVSRAGNGVNTAPYANSGTGPLNTHDCLYDAPTTNATGYHFFCFDANAQGGGLIAYGAGGVASPLPLQFSINGTLYQFPFVSSGVVGPPTSVVGHVACWNNTVGTLLSDCNTYAPLNSPAFTGTPTAPTPGSNISTTQLPTTAWVNNWFAPLLSPTFTGVPAAPTPGSNISTTQISTTAWVNAWFAPLNSPALTGTPTVPTPAANDNSTKAVNSAWVRGFAQPIPTIASCATTVQTAKTANYPVVNADSGTTFLVSNRSTISFPNAYTQGFCVNIYNSNVGKAVIVTVNGVSVFLWPNQTETVYAVSGGSLTYTGPHRYKIANPTLNVGVSPNCNDANDGLSADAGGWLCHANIAVSLLQSSFDSLGTNAAIQLANGTYNEAIFNAGYGPHTVDAINLLGNAGSRSSVVLLAPTNGTALAARDYGAWIAQNLTIGCTNVGSTGVNSSQFGVVDLINVTIGSCDNNVMLIAQDGGHINLEGGFLISGNAVVFALSQNIGSLINLTNQVITCSGNPAFSYFVNAQFLAMINGTGATFTGCGGVGAQRYIVAVNGVVSSGAGGANFFPGNVPGATSTGGQYQ